MEIKDIPNAVFNAEFKLISPNKMMVSRIREVIKQLKPQASLYIKQENQY